MIYVPIKYAKPGMTISRNVYGSVSAIPLITYGQTLDMAMIERLRARGVSGVHIQGGEAYQQEVLPSLLPPQVKEQMHKNIKTTFQRYMRMGKIDPRGMVKMKEAASDLVNGLLNADELMINILEIKDYDEYTYSHSLCVGVLSGLMGAALGYGEYPLLHLTMAGLLHDLGKVDIPEQIINKPTRLSQEEFRQVKRHPELAVDKLKACGSISSATLAGIASHHEWLDGGGYPAGSKGKAIPVYGRILAIADVYDALTSKRPYREAWQPSEAIECMRQDVGRHFDVELLDLFLELIVIYPVGTLVTLSNGWTAVVNRVNRKDSYRPVVGVLAPEQAAPQEIDLAQRTDLYITGIVYAHMPEAGDQREPPGRGG